MTIYQWGLAIAGIIGAIALIAGPLCSWLLNAAVHHDHGYGDALAQFRDQCRAQGMTPSETNDHIWLREQFAGLRREASAAVAGNPAQWFDALVKAKDESSARVAMARPDLLPLFSRMIVAGNYSDILFPQEAAMVDKLMASPRSKLSDKLHADMVNSMRAAR